METINIVCACDKHFLPFTASLICSVLENNPMNNIRIFLLFSGINKLELQKLTAFVQNYQQTIIPIRVQKKDIKGLLKWISEAASFRLIMHNLLPIDVEKVIYLDSDILVRHDLSDLWEIDLADSILAAVEDPASIEQSKLGMAKTSRFFNSGVLLVDLKRWKESNLLLKVLAYYEDHPNLYFPDQDALNAVLDGEWMQLSQNWNMICRVGSRDVLEQQKIDPAVVHFAGSGENKPWHPKSNVPFKDEYIYYQMKTPWRNIKSLYNRGITLILLKSRTYSFLKKKTTNGTINTIKNFIFRIAHRISP